jgi:hypothetical protein
LDNQEQKMNPPIYPLEVTADEGAAGFYRTEIEHLNLKQGGKERMPAVVCPFGKSFRVVKRWNPARSNEHYYSLEVFGVYRETPEATPQWHQLQPPNFASLNDNDANRIVEALAQWIALGNNKHYLLRDPQLLDVEP